LRRIEDFPQTGARVPEVDESNIRRMPVHRFPYHVVFVILSGSIEVIAFAHDRRRPRYFMRRRRKTE
jgi:plasmid stabilization system protein ParE